MDRKDHSDHHHRAEDGQKNVFVNIVCSCLLYFSRLGRPARIKQQNHTILIIINIPFRTAMQVSLYYNNSHHDHISHHDILMLAKMKNVLTNWTVPFSKAIQKMFHHLTHQKVSNHTQKLCFTDNNYGNNNIITTSLLIPTYTLSSSISHNQKKFSFLLFFFLNKVQCREKKKKKTKSLQRKRVLFFLSTAKNETIPVYPSIAIWPKKYHHQPLSYTETILSTFTAVLITRARIIVFFSIIIRV